MTIESILAKKGTALFKTRPDAMIRDIIGNFARNKAGSLVVIDGNGFVVGILTERDIVTALGERGERLLSLFVSDVMTKSYFRCKPEDSITSALEVMGRGQARYMTVVSHGQLVGIVSLIDLVSARLVEKDADIEWMKEYISGDYSIHYEGASAE